MVSRLIFLFLISLICACSVSNKSSNLEMIGISQADSIAGKQAIGESDCYTCHKHEEKFVGPAFLSIAGKYHPTNSDVAGLTKKIKEGGSGSWGKVPMLPHPTLSQEDAQKMIYYILSLNKK